MSDPVQEPLSDPLASRRVALDVLGQTLQRHQSLDEALATHPDFDSLAPRDRAFVRLLLATTLRRLGEIDSVLGQLMERLLPQQAATGTDVLRLGAAQLLFLGTPAHAAVDTSVELIAASGLPRLRGLANAVLRRVAREGTALLGDRDPLRLNTPGWLWESWVETFGEATARSIAAAHLVEAPLDLTVARDAAAWAERLEAELLPTGTLRRAAGGMVTDLPGFDEGAWWVQDAAAALPARLLGAGTGSRVIDLCAAPGGKTLQLCAAGAAVTAVDISNRRLGRVRENLARCGFEAELVAADASKWRPAAPAHAVLLDAPCSATGTLRRHPDIAWLKGPDDVARLTLTQDRLLRAASEMLEPGGMLIYAVCALQAEEGPQRIAAALASGVPLRREPVTAGELPGLTEAITSDGDVRTLPSMWAERGGMDGFYIARLRRL
jgi:16S rRNA (cytosine967-C5)-methyltransferase